MKTCRTLKTRGYKKIETQRNFFVISPVAYAALYGPDVAADEAAPMEEKHFPSKSGSKSPGGSKKSSKEPAVAISRMSSDSESLAALNPPDRHDGPYRVEAIVEKLRALHGTKVAQNEGVFRTTARHMRVLETRLDALDPGNPKKSGALAVVPGANSSRQPSPGSQNSSRSQSPDVSSSQMLHPPQICKVATSLNTTAAGGAEVESIKNRPAEGPLALGGPLDVVAEMLDAKELCPNGCGCYIDKYKGYEKHVRQFCKVQAAKNLELAVEAGLSGAVPGGLGSGANEHLARLSQRVGSPVPSPLPSSRNSRAGGASPGRSGRETAVVRDPAALVAMLGKK